MTNRIAWRPLRLDTLVRLRWLAISGQTLAVLVVAFVLRFPLPLLACFGVIGMSMLLNFWIVSQLGTGRRLTERFALVQLAFDCAQLGALLGLTGGLENPFALLLLAPVSVSATTLQLRSTLLLTVLVAGIATLLAVFHLPLPWSPEAPLRFNALYLTGVWAAILLGVAFVAAYTTRVAHEARQLADALTATELTLSRQQQLSALDGLAAAAAHELGTPLSTIALAAKEMRAELPDGPIAEDADLIIAQANRCRAILAKLRDLDQEGSDPFATVSLADLVAEVVKPLEVPHKTVSISTDGDTDAPLMVQRNVGLLYGLGNIIENAVRFAKKRVEIEVRWRGQEVRVTVTDDGPGFSPEVIDKLGEPYVSRPRGPEESERRSGLGLGIFIAKTLLERTGARLTFGNAYTGAHARVEVVWPGGLETES